ncbi:GntR family transcriptional regulator [Mycetocola spongiae]|uniref:GntR family transcriptional regulator n=1 Tax=Mycetocola spongiae TaxID=2859226 RepID=UPI001CF1D064|nr:GntR family transcriptional regulator [Mycetocola spongiae]UCR90412.1 GntR family transcriptional regulator [Mycetocola spongiae]
MVIERKTLRSQVREEILARMRTGAVQPGESINEVLLATELGVSRTPLREALIGLEAEGQITSENGKGFRFVRLSATDFAELGPIMATLEALAIELTPAAELEGIGRRLLAMSAANEAREAEPSLAVSLDDEWHETMIGGCPNQRLLEVIANNRELVHRYESVLTADRDTIEREAAEHTLIADAMIAGDVPAAKAALLANWQNGVVRLLEHARTSYVTP